MMARQRSHDLMEQRRIVQPRDALDSEVVKIGRRLVRKNGIAELDDGFEDLIVGGVLISDGWAAVVQLQRIAL